MLTVLVCGAALEVIAWSADFATARDALLTNLLYTADGWYQDHVIAWWEGGASGRHEVVHPDGSVDIWEFTTLN